MQFVREWKNRFGKIRVKRYYPNNQFESIVETLKESFRCLLPLLLFHVHLVTPTMRFCNDSFSVSTKVDLAAIDLLEFFTWKTFLEEMVKIRFYFPEIIRGKYSRLRSKSVYKILREIDIHVFFLLIITLVEIILTKFGKNYLSNLTKIISAREG